MILRVLIGRCLSRRAALTKRNIAYFSEREGRVVIRKMLALPFGATRAVFSYLRVAHSIWYIGCKALKLIWSHFFDDFICLSAEQESKSVDLAVMTLFRLLGWKVFGIERQTFLYRVWSSWGADQLREVS